MLEVLHAIFSPTTAIEFAFALCAFTCYGITGFGTAAVFISAMHTCSLFSESLCPMDLKTLPLCVTFMVLPMQLYQAINLRKNFDLRLFLAVVFAETACGALGVWLQYKIAVQEMKFAMGCLFISICWIKGAKEFHDAAKKTESPCKGQTSDKQPVIMEADEGHEKGGASQSVLVEGELTQNSGTNQECCSPKQSSAFLTIAPKASAPIDQEDPTKSSADDCQQVTSESKKNSSLISSFKMLAFTLFCASFAGLTAGLFAVGGPPMMLYIMFSKIPKDKWRGTSAAFWFAGSCFRLPTYAIMNQHSSQPVVLGWREILVLPVAAFIGTNFGNILSKKVNQNAFLRIVLFNLLMVSLQMVRDEVSRNAFISLCVFLLGSLTSGVFYLYLASHRHHICTGSSVSLCSPCPRWFFLHRFYPLHDNGSTLTSGESKFWAGFCHLPEDEEKKQELVTLSSLKSSWPQEEQQGAVELNIHVIDDCDNYDQLQTRGATNIAAMC